jgi:hypothetical protein
MPTVETTVSVTVPEGASIPEIEEAIVAALRPAGGELLQQAVQALEENALAMTGANRDKLRSQNVLTSFGWLKLERLYVRERATGRYGYLVALGSGQRHATKAVIDRAVELATRIPYRQATTLLARQLNAPIDHRSLYQWVRDEGQAIVDEECALQAAVFEDGVVPERSETPHEVLVAVVDGAYIKAQREGQPSFELRIGVAYSGRSLTRSKHGRHRYRLRERQLYGGVDSARDFAERFYLHCEATLGLSLAQHLLLLGDGADWIEGLAGHDRYKATYQLDHWHILDHARRAFGDRPALVNTIARALHEGDTERILRLVTLARHDAKAGEEHDRIAQYEAYLRNNLHGIHGARRLRAALSEEAQEAIVEGSGAVEKQADLLVARRFEHHGMRWTKAGANSLFKLRLRELERAA